jgi:DNA-binding NtrC family response regulator
MKETILIVDDDTAFCKFLEKALSAKYGVSSFTNPLKALEILKEKKFNLIITDLYMPEMDGIKFLETIKSASPAQDILLMTAHAEIKTAIDSIKKGASDYLIKPFQTDELFHTVNYIFEKQKLIRENQLLREQLDEKNRPDNIIGNSRKVHEVFELIKKVADANSTVLITGESGTGKELVAKAIHYYGTRRDKRFVPVNCSAIPENLLESELFGHSKGAFSGAAGARAGLFKYGDKGTLFLDEIADMPLTLQSKLLRVIQEQKVRSVGEEEEHEIDVRFIAATSRDLNKMVADKTFREDLYYRINVIPIHLPPLRERAEDIPLLIKFFIANSRLNNKSFSDETMKYLMEHYWPGNIRELKNTIERMMILSKDDFIDVDDLPFEILNNPKVSQMPKPGSYSERKKTVIEQFNRDVVLEALRKSEGNVTKAAAILDLERASFQRIMRVCEIRSEDFR